MAPGSLLMFISIHGTHNIRVIVRVSLSLHWVVTHTHTHTNKHKQTDKWTERQANSHGCSLHVNPFFTVTATIGSFAGTNSHTHIKPMPRIVSSCNPLSPLSLSLYQHCALRNHH